MTHEDFNELYAATFGPLWAYVRRLVVQAEHADEVTQEAYVRLLGMSAERTMTKEHQRHALFRIATNLARDHHRARGRFDDAPVERGVPALTESQTMAHQLVEKTFETLRDQDRALLWLAYAEGASHQEIAAATGYRSASVRPLLHQAKKRALGTLRRLLSHSSPEREA